MKIKSLIRAASVSAAAIITMAASAYASSITFNTNSPGSEFVSPSSGLTLNSATGEAATLTFVADPNTVIGVPSNVNFGIFTLSCLTCTSTLGSSFSAFTFDLVIHDVTDGAFGTFVGSSTGGSVYDNSSQITINWLPASLGPGTTGADSGSFGQTIFETVSTSRIVAPNSGSVPGQTTIQGGISAVPEPATFGLIGVALLGLGVFGRKKLVRS